MKHLAIGLYESLIDEFLRDAIARRPELRTVFGKIDPEEQLGMYASFVAKVVEQALRKESDPERRLALCNRILDQVVGELGLGHLVKHHLVKEQKPTLLGITPTHYGTSGIPRTRLLPFIDLKCTFPMQERLSMVNLDTVFPCGYN